MFESPCGVGGFLSIVSRSQVGGKGEGKETLDDFVCGRDLAAAAAHFTYCTWYLDYHRSEIKRSAVKSCLLLGKAVPRTGTQELSAQVSNCAMAKRWPMGLYGDCAAALLLMYDSKQVIFPGVNLTTEYVPSPQVPDLNILSWDLRVSTTSTRTLIDLLSWQSLYRTLKF